MTGHVHEWRLVHVDDGLGAGQTQRVCRWCDVVRDTTAPVQVQGFFVLRYFPEVDMAQRAHEHTLGRFGSWVAADDARGLRPVARLLDVHERRVEREAAA